MKTYEIFLHYKQGDDFAAHVDATNNVSDALTGWAADFRKRTAVCEEIARALHGKNVEVDAQVHMILLTPKDAEAERALDDLLALGHVSRSSITDDFDQDA